jgi:TRAP-type C4-dicarboxylate transport system permease large subunit
MITPFEVYVVMQLDSIKVLFILLSLAGILPILGLKLSASIDRYSSEAFPNNPISKQQSISADNADKAFNKLLYPAIISTIMAVLIPSSATAAAMIVLSEITSKEVTEPLKGEAREIYQLAKDALKNIADDKKPEPSK